MENDFILVNNSKFLFVDDNILKRNSAAIEEVERRRGIRILTSEDYRNIDLLRN